MNNDDNAGGAAVVVVEAGGRRATVRARRSCARVRIGVRRIRVTVSTLARPHSRTDPLHFISSPPVIRLPQLAHRQIGLAHPWRPLCAAFIINR